MSELKDCPFCGGEAEIFRNEAGFHAGCHTEGCMCESGLDVFYTTYEECRLAWNHREQLVALYEQATKHNRIYYMIERFGHGWLKNREGGVLSFTKSIEDALCFCDKHSAKIIMDDWGISTIGIAITEHMDMNGPANYQPEPGQPAAVYEAACSGLRYGNPDACGEVTAIWIDGKRWAVQQLAAGQSEPVAEPTTEDFRRAFDGKIDLSAFHDARELWRAGKQWKISAIPAAPAVPDGWKFRKMDFGIAITQPGKGPYCALPQEHGASSLAEAILNNLGMAILAASPEQQDIQAVPDDSALMFEWEDVARALMISSYWFQDGGTHFASVVARCRHDAAAIRRGEKRSGGKHAFKSNPNQQDASK